MAALISKTPLPEIPGFSKLIGDYLKGEKNIRHLFKYEYRLDSFKEIIIDKAKDPTNRELLVKVLKKQYADIELSPATDANIAALLSSATFTLTAAHQPCVLLGPVFNIYKIASAINLAQELNSRQPENHFVPVFWMGSEDHDFEELSSTYVLGNKIEWPAHEGEAGAYGRRSLDGFEVVLNEAQAFAGGQALPLLEKLKEALSRFRTFGAYTRYLLHELFGEHGLVVIDQDDAELKQQFKSIIADELQFSTAAPCIGQSVDWLEKNYSVQASPREINLFYLSSNSRERIIRAEEDFAVNNTGLRFSRAQMLEMADKQPELFSPNVILRPLYQEMTLPNLAFIGGAGELSYWMELKDLFDHYRINFPMLVMRASMTVINSSAEKKMAKFGLSAAGLLGKPEHLVNRFIKSTLSGEAQLEKEKLSIAELFDAVAQKAENIDPTLKASVLGEKQKQLHALEALEAKFLKAEKRRQEETVSQLKALSNTFQPFQNWQERVENFLAFYSKDPNFIKNAVELAAPFEGAMLVINQDR